jgi:dipeptidyl aminopeptidase/acylaminoacyl peptidase
VKLSLPRDWSVLVAFALLVIPPTAAAQQRFTLELSRRLVRLSSPAPAPDGRTVALVVAHQNFAEDQVESELWAVDVSTRSSRPLTHERRRVGQPHWSPDGKTLAFTAPDTAGHDQIWLMPMNGGDARQLTASATGVAHYSWRPDGGAIAFAAADEDPGLKGDAKHLSAFEAGDQDLFLRRPIRPQHIWLISTAGGPAERLTGGSWSLEFALPPSSPPSGLSWSPDGREIAFARVPAAESGKLDSVSIWLLGMSDRSIRPLGGARRFQNNPRFSPDGRSLSYWYPRDGRGDIGWVNEVYVEPRGGGVARSLTRGIDRNLFSSDWVGGGKAMLVAGNDRTTVGVWVQPLDGPAKRLDLGDLVVTGAYGYELEPAPTGQMFFVASSARRPAELYVVDTPSAKPRRLTEFNAWADSVAFGPMERVTWTGHDGAAEDGVLVRPADFSTSRTYPLVLVIHGGPNSASKQSFSTLAQLMAAEGWLVFMPNYRGSDNLGNAYYSAIVGDWGEGPGRDVMAGIAELRKQPWVDRSRTAVSGWSYGGYMTTWLLGKYPDEWRAGMAGAPVTSLQDEYNFSDGNVGWRYLFNGSPWREEYARKYAEQSPITYATRIKAPTLVMTNLEDFRVPPTQAFALHRALKDNQVETGLVVFAGRTHYPVAPVDGEEVLRRWLGWIKQHIGERRPAVP